jgi:hypothetical protein
VNNVIACEDKESVTYKTGQDQDQEVFDVSSKYVFDNDLNILPNGDQDLDPFIEYDKLGYEEDKNKHKKQKNINRLGMVVMSTAVVMGSAWINSLWG